MTHGTLIPDEDGSFTNFPWAMCDLETGLGIGVKRDWQIEGLMHGPSFRKQRSCYPRGRHVDDR